jgi:yecA family protein
MNVEQLDGFLAAVIARPENVMPGEYCREVFGGETSDVCEFDSLNEVNGILGLMMWHSEHHRRDAVQGRGRRERLGSHFSRLMTRFARVSRSYV